MKVVILFGHGTTGKNTQGAKSGIDIVVIKTMSSVKKKEIENLNKS